MPGLGYLGFLLFQIEFFLRWHVGELSGYELSGYELSVYALWMTSGMPVSPNYTRHDSVQPAKGTTGTERKGGTVV